MNTPKELLQYIWRDFLVHFGCAFTFCRSLSSIKPPSKEMSSPARKSNLMHHIFNGSAHNYLHQQLIQQYDPHNRKLSVLWLLQRNEQRAATKNMPLGYCSRRRAHDVAASMSIDIGKELCCSLHPPTCCTHLDLHIAAALLASSLGRQLFWARGAPHASWLLVQATVEAQEGGSTTWRRCHKECCCDHHSSVSYTRLSAVGPGNRESSSRRVHSVASTPARAPLQSPLAGELQGAF